MAIEYALPEKNLEDFLTEIRSSVKPPWTKQ